MLVFDKLCERKLDRKEYFYTQVTYDYEFLEDYLDIYRDFHEGGFKPRELESKLEERSDLTDGTRPYLWGPDRYKYDSHPLYLMVSSHYTCICMHVFGMLACSDLIKTQHAPDA